MLNYKGLDISVEAEQTSYKKGHLINYEALDRVSSRIRSLYEMGIEIIGLPTHTGLSEGRRIPNISALDYLSDKTRARFMFHIKPFHFEDGRYVGKSEQRIEGELLELERSYGNRIAYILPITGDRELYTEKEKPDIVKPKVIYDGQEKGVSSKNILEIMYRLNNGVTHSGYRIKPSKFNPIAVAINPWSSNPIKNKNEPYKYNRKSGESAHLRQKIDALRHSAKIIGVTQPVYPSTIEDLEYCLIDCMDNVERHDPESQLTFIVGIAPVRNIQSANYIRNRVKGFNIPDSYYEQLKQSNGTGEYFAVQEAAKTLNMISRLKEELFDKYGKEVISGVHFYMADDANFLGNILESAENFDKSSLRSQSILNNTLQTS